MKESGTRKRIIRIIMRISARIASGIIKRQTGILLRIDGTLGAEYSVKLIGRYFIHKIKRNGGFDFSKLLRKSKNDKQQF